MYRWDRDGRSFEIINKCSIQEFGRAPHLSVYVLTHPVMVDVKA